MVTLSISDEHAAKLAADSGATGLASNLLLDAILCDFFAGWGTKDRGKFYRQMISQEGNPTIRDFALQLASEVRQFPVQSITPELWRALRNVEDFK